MVKLVNPNSFLSTLVRLLLARFNVFRAGRSWNAAGCTTPILLSDKSNFFKLVNPLNTRASIVDSRFFLRSNCSNCFKSENAPSSILSIWLWCRFKILRPINPLKSVFDTRPNWLYSKNKPSNLCKPFNTPCWIDVNLLFSRWSRVNSGIWPNVPLSTLEILLSFNQRNSNDEDNPVNEFLLIDRMSLCPRYSHIKFDRPANVSFGMSLILLKMRDNEFNCFNSENKLGESCTRLLSRSNRTNLSKPLNDSLPTTDILLLKPRLSLVVDRFLNAPSLMESRFMSCISSLSSNSCWVTSTSVPFLSHTL